MCTCLPGLPGYLAAYFCRSCKRASKKRPGRCRCRRGCSLQRIVPAYGALDNSPHLFLFPFSPHQIIVSISTVFSTSVLHTCASPLHIHLHQPGSLSLEHSIPSVNLALLVSALLTIVASLKERTYLHLSGRLDLSRLTGRAPYPTALKVVPEVLITGLCCSSSDKCKRLNRNIRQRVPKRLHQQVLDITASAITAPLACLCISLGHMIFDCI